MCRQAQLYAPGSTSLPAETAAALTESILLTLGADRDPRALLAPDLPARLRRGQGRLRQKLTIFRRLLRTALATVPARHCPALEETLESLRRFPARYDWRFFAQEIPCEIDYLLAQPVPETLRGIDYVNEWLRRLCLEQDFLRRFDRTLLRHFLSAAAPDDAFTPENLFEPAAVSALGLALLGEDPRGLFLPPPLRQRLERRLAPLSDTLRKKALTGAADALCDAMGLRSAFAVRYLRGTACALHPRLSAALDAGSAAAIFPWCAPETPDGAS